MRYTVVIEEPAEQELDDAFLWSCAMWPLAQAEKWFSDLLKAVDSLSRFPKRHSLALENQAFEEEIRHHLYGRGRGQYRILFAVRGRKVHVLHIRRSVMRPPEL
jgi:plasmid stabilization system protein ParE